MTREELQQAAMEYCGEDTRLQSAFVFGADYAWEHPHWIPVEEELPKKLEGVGVSTYVLVKYGLSEDKEYNVMRYNYRVNRWFDKSYKSHKNVTHWMEIVPPKKEG